MNYGVYSDVNGQDQKFVLGDKVEEPQILFFGRSEGFRQKLCAGILVTALSIISMY